MFDFCSKITKALPFNKTAETEAAEEEELEAGQEHVYTFYESLTEEEKRELDDEYEDLREEYGEMMDKIEEYWVSARDHKNMLEKGLIVVDPPRLMNWDLKKPPPVEAGANITRLNDVGERKLHAWRSTGFELYQKGRVGVVVLCGGLDSRLGESVPKGVVDIGLLSQKSIFQLYAERIKRLQHLVHRKSKRMSYVPIYIMCNQANFDLIEDFWRENNFFGLRDQDVLFFQQGYFPALDLKGKFLLQEKHKIMQFPSGNGAVFRALKDEGMISDMKSRGVMSIYVCSIDNVLAKVGDPLFLGYCDTCRAECGVKCIEKLIPEESFGVYCSKHEKVHEDIDGDGKLDSIIKYKAAVFEFFEISDDQKKRRANNGTRGLYLCSGNLSQYYFNVDFVMRVIPKMKTWHLIRKKFDYVDLWTGSKVSPGPTDDANGDRMEMWVFDAFEHSSKVVGLQVPRDEYALVKNVQGQDSPQTALQAVGRLHQAWILKAGGVFFDNKVASENDDAKCEVSPLVSYEGEDLAGQFLKPVLLPYYLPSHLEMAEISAIAPTQTRRASIHYLDLDANLAQRELEMELQGTLGKVMERIQSGNPDAMNYAGEQADEEEILPPTPRQIEHDTYRDELRTSPRGASARLATQGIASARGNETTPRQSMRKASPAAMLEAGAAPGGNMSLRDKDLGK